MLIELIIKAIEEAAERSKRQRQQADPAWQAQQAAWEQQRREWEAQQLRAAVTPPPPTVPTGLPPVPNRPAGPPPLRKRKPMAGPLVAGAELATSAAAARGRPVLVGSRPGSLRSQFVLSEVLKPPLSLREPR